MDIREGGVDTGEKKKKYKEGTKILSEFAYVKKKFEYLRGHRHGTNAVPPRRYSRTLVLIRKASRLKIKIILHFYPQILAYVKLL